MERMVAQCGVTVETQKHLHRRSHLPGTLDGPTGEVEQETLEAGVNRLGEAGGSSTLKRPREAGMHLALHPRIRKPVLGTEL